MLGTRFSQRLLTNKQAGKPTSALAAFTVLRWGGGGGAVPLSEHKGGEIAALTSLTRWVERRKSYRVYPALVLYLIRLGRSEKEDSNKASCATIALSDKFCIFCCARAVPLSEHKSSGGIEIAALTSLTCWVERRKTYCVYPVLSST